MDKKYVLKDYRGRQVGRPNRSVKALLQKGYDLLADVDMTTISKKDLHKLVYTVEDA
jgi:hypothetical protein